MGHYIATVKPKKSLGNIVIVDKHEWFEANPPRREERYDWKFR